MTTEQIEQPLTPIHTHEPKLMKDDPAYRFNSRDEATQSAYLLNKLENLSEVPSKLDQIEPSELTPPTNILTQSQQEKQDERLQRIAALEESSKENLLEKVRKTFMNLIGDQPTKEKVVYPTQDEIDEVKLKIDKEAFDYMQLHEANMGPPLTVFEYREALARIRDIIEAEHAQKRRNRGRNTTTLVTGLTVAAALAACGDVAEVQPAATVNTAGSVVTVAPHPTSTPDLTQRAIDEQEENAQATNVAQVKATDKAPVATTKPTTTAHPTEAPKTPEAKKLTEMQAYELVQARKIVTDSRTVSVSGVQIQVVTGFIGDLNSSQDKVLKSNSQLENEIGIDVNNIKFAGAFASTDKTNALANSLGLLFYLNNKAYVASQTSPNERPQPTLVDGFNKMSDVGGTKLSRQISQTLSPALALQFGSQKVNRDKFQSITLSQVGSVAFMFTNQSETGLAVSSGVPGSGIQNIIAINESTNHPGKYDIVMAVQITQSQLDAGNKNWNLTQNQDAKKKIPGLEGSLNFSGPILSAFVNADIQQPRDSSYQDGVNFFNEISRNGYSEAAIPSSKKDITLSDVEQFNTFLIPYR